MRLWLISQAQRLSEPRRFDVIPAGLTVFNGSLGVEWYTATTVGLTPIIWTRLTAISFPSRFLWLSFPRAIRMSFITSKFGGSWHMYLPPSDFNCRTCYSAPWTRFTRSESQASVPKTHNDIKRVAGYILCFCEVTHIRSRLDLYKHVGNVPPEDYTNEDYCLHLRPFLDADLCYPTKYKKYNEFRFWVVIMRLRQGGVEYEYREGSTYRSSPAGFSRKLWEAQ